MEIWCRVNSNDWRDEEEGVDGETRRNGSVWYN